MTSIIDINSFTELFIQKNRNNKKPQFIPLKRKKIEYIVHLRNNDKAIGR